MNRILPLGLVLLTTGCVHFKPIGPLAQYQGLSPDGKPAAEAAPEPILREAPRPTPPAVYVTPGEVTPANVDEAIKRLTQELDTDRRTMEAFPRYAEVSIVK
jgi:hypothetical protein